MNAIDRILVVCEDSRAGRRGLRSAAAVADEHRARISVVSMINPEPRTVGCCMRSDQWNRIRDEVAHEQLDSAYFAGWSVRRLRRGMRADVGGVRSA